MRTKHRIITLLTAFALMICMTVSVSAENYSETGTCTFDGSTLDTSFENGSLTDAMSNLEPGDTLKYLITYENGSDITTYWYMFSKVVQTLEESQDIAKNGGYTFVLKNIGPGGDETTYFDNSEVGGDTVIADLEGLKQATNATQDYFFIQQLGPGETGQTYLEVAFDGETQANAYNDTIGALEIAYAVETKVNGETEKGKNKIVYQNNPRTGDQSDLLKYILLMTAALILAILAFILRRRDKRREGEA